MTEQERIARIICQAADYDPDAVICKGDPPSGPMGEWRDGEWVSAWEQWRAFAPYADEILAALTPPADCEAIARYRTMARALFRGGMTNGALYLDEAADRIEALARLASPTPMREVAVKAMAQAIQNVKGGMNYDYADFCLDAASAAFDAAFATPPIKEPLTTETADD